jgi:hypothetical protein
MFGVIPLASRGWRCRFACCRITFFGEHYVSEYDHDYYAWLQRQAQLLCVGGLSEIDAGNPAFEVELLALQQTGVIGRSVRELTEHALLLCAVPQAKERDDWEQTIARHRQIIRITVESSPSLKARLKPAIDRRWNATRELVAAQLAAFGYAGYEIPDDVTITYRDIFGADADELMG